ncbi:MAG: hypothetical protein ACOVNU_05860 [Candidatus Kapaibacteriota bacterium]
MKNRLKNLYYERFLEVFELDNSYPLTNAQKRNICNLLASSGTDLYEDNFKKLNESYQEVVLSNEKTRTQFIGMINFIEKNTKVLINNFITQGVIRLQHNAIKKKQMVEAKTTILVEVADYLNIMNDLVLSFYTDVYKIDKVDEKEKQKEKIQGQLF